MEVYQIFNVKTPAERKASIRYLLATVLDRPGILLIKISTPRLVSLSKLNLSIRQNAVNTLPASSSAVLASVR